MLRMFKRRFCAHRYTVLVHILQNNPILGSASFSITLTKVNCLVFKKNVQIFLHLRGCELLRRQRWHKPVSPPAGSCKKQPVKDVYHWVYRVLPAHEHTANVPDRLHSAAAGRRRHMFMVAPSLQQLASPQAKANLHFFLNTRQLTVVNVILNEAAPKMQSFRKT